MNKTNPFEVLNDNMEFLVDYLKRELRCLGMMNGLSDSQISDMERDFIARLAFAAIIGDDEKEPEKKTEKEPDKKPEKEPENKTVPDVVWKCLNYVKDYCKERDCDGCVFSEDNYCKIKYTPNKWKV